MIAMPIIFQYATFVSYVAYVMAYHFSFRSEEVLVDFTIFFEKSLT